MAFKFYIDNQLTDQPVNDTALSTSIRRDSTLGALLITQDVELVYNGNNNLNAGEISGYAYLKSLFEDAICNEAEIEIYDAVSPANTVLIYKGIIKIPSVSIDLQAVLLTTKIQDNSFYSYINNNKEIKVNLAAIETKSLIEIAPIDWYSVDLFNSVNCVYGSTITPVPYLYKGYRIYDVMEFIIKVITDEKVTFQSTFLSTLTSELFLFKGQSLLNSYTAYPTAEVPILEVSFQEIFTELDKIYNLVFWIDYTDPENAVFRLENYESTFGSTLVYSFNDIKEMKQSIVSSNLYSQVNTGSEFVVDGNLAAYTWEGGRSYYGWKKESFHTLGQCNLNTVLNLVSNFIIDSNAIQDVLTQVPVGTIDDYYLIQCDMVDTVNLTAVATQFEFFGDGGCYYNLGINNIYKMERHSVKFESSFGNFLGQGTDKFKALLGDDDTNNIVYQNTNPLGSNYVGPGQLDVDPSPFPNVTTNGGFDGNNNYNVITYRYVVPVAGDYSFTHRLHYQFAEPSPGNNNYQITPRIRQYDSLSVLITTQQATAPTTNNGTFFFPISAVFNCQVGDIIEASYNLAATGNALLEMKFDSFFECTGTPDSGISIAAGNPDIKKYTFEFSEYVNQSDFLNIVNNLTGLFAFEKDGLTRYGWLSEVKYNNWTTLFNCKITTNDAITTE